ncbi:MAG: MFS transporter [Candidatus Heimdallarchaeota archaeon]|nr:MFS transporter [Candidatus Heimdallarchaeota archaeon]
MSIFRREVLVAANVSLFATFLQVMVMAYLGIHLNSFQTSALLIGFIFGVRNFIQIFFRIPIGEFSQVVGRKPLLVVALGFYSLAHFILYLSTNWIYDLIATIILGFGMTFYYPSLFAYIGDIADESYGKINGFVFQGADVAIIVGTFIVKKFLDKGSFTIDSKYLTYGLIDIGSVRIGFNDPIELNLIFLGSAIIGVFGVIINSLLLRETLSDEERKIVPSKLRSLGQFFRNSHRSFKELSKNQKLRPVYQLQFVVAFGEFFFQSFIGLLVVLSLGYTEGDVAYVLSLGTLILFPLKPFLGSISDKLGYRNPILVSLILNGFLLILITQATQLWMVIVIFAFYMANNMTSYLACNGATSHNSKNNQRGVAMGVLGVYVSIGRTLSSLLLGVIWQIMTVLTDDKGESLIAVFMFTGVILLISSIVMSQKIPSEIGVVSLSGEFEINELHTGGK